MLSFMNQPVEPKEKRKKPVEPKVQIDEKKVDNPNTL
jgi:hypothetical protein